MPSVIKIGKGGGRDRNNETNERREFEGKRTSKLDEKVERTKGDDQAGTEMEAERREQSKNKSENELKGVKKEDMERQAMNEGKETKDDITSILRIGSSPRQSTSKNHTRSTHRYCRTGSRL